MQIKFLINGKSELNKELPSRDVEVLEILVTIQLEGQAGAQEFRQTIGIHPSYKERQIALMIGMSLEQIGKQIQKQVEYGIPSEETLWNGKKEYTF